MDNNKEDLIAQLRIRRAELRQLIYEKDNLFDYNRQPSNNLRDLEENINQCKSEISRIKTVLKISKNNYLPNKYEQINLAVSKTLHTFA